jgi:hypothetical protein
MSRGGSHKAGPKPLLQQDLNQVFGVFSRRQHRLREITFHNSTHRMDLRHRLDNLEQHLARLQDSLGLLVDKPLPANLDTPPKKLRARRRKLQHTVVLDVDALNRQIQNLNSISEELRDDDRKQVEAESLCDNATQALSTELRKQGLVLDDDAGSDVFLAPTPTAQSVGSIDDSPPIPAELEAYYAAFSHSRNMSERIGELQVEQQEQWVRRGLEEDQGQLLDQSDDEFLRTWNETLEIAYNDYETAEAAVKEAREACDRKNIEIPSSDKVYSIGNLADLTRADAPDQGMVSPPNSVPVSSRIVNRMYANEPLLHDHGSPLATPPINNPLATERVARWVETVDVQPTTDILDPPVNWSGDVTKKSANEATRTSFQRNDEVAQYTSSANIVTTTDLSDVALGPTSASLGAEQRLEIDDTIWDVAPSSTAP